MKKIKRHLLHLLQMGLALGIMALLSFLPVELLNGIGTVSLIIALILFGVMCIIYFKRVRSIACFLMILVLSFSSFARSIEDCDAYDLSSVQEGNFCRSNVLEETLGSDVCKYMKTFNPSKVKTGDEQTKMQTIVNDADKIVQAYNELEDSYKNSLSGSCQTLTLEDNNKSQAERLKILNNNNTPICCAWAMQSKYQMYTAQNSERQIETVPMMLAKKKLQCWPCDVVYMLITLANTMAYRSAPSMAAVGLFFLKWMMIFWIILKVGCLFLNRNSDGKPYALGNFLKDMLARVCWAGLAALIISGTAAQLNDKTVTNRSNIYATRKATLLDQAYQKIINPPFEMIAAVGIEIASALMRGESSFYGKVAQAVDQQADANVRVYGSAMQSTNYCKIPSCPKTGNESDNTGCWMGDNPMYQHLTRGGPSSEFHLDVVSQGRAISNETTRNLLCLTQLSFQGLAPISAAGSIITTHAIKNAWSLPFPLPGTVPIMPQLFYGLLLMIVCWLLGVAVGFRLIDIMVRVAMVIMLCPIFIVAAVFPLTRDKAKTAVTFFVSAIMGFVEVAIAVGMIVPCFYHAIATNGNEKELINAMVAPSTSKYVPDLYDQFSKGGAKFFIFITVVGWMGFKMLESVSNFFEQIFSLKSVGKIGAGQGGSMVGAMNSMREDVGASVDWAKKFSKDTGLGKKLKKTKAGRGWQSLKSAGSRAYGGVKGAAGKVVDTAEKATDAAGSAVQKGGKTLMQKGAQVSKSGWGALVGVPMMLAGALMQVGGWATKKAGKAWKTAVKGAGRATEAFARKQSRMALYDFFHPKASDEDREEYKRSLENKK